VHVLGVSIGADGGLVLEVETDQVLAGCASCGVVAVGHGRRLVQLHDAPCFARPVLVRSRKRVWRCAEATNTEPCLIPKSQIRTPTHVATAMPGEEIDAFHRRRPFRA
jgi:transposase